MPDSPDQVCEVTYRVDRDVVEDFDAWLAGHTADLMELPGVSGATCYEVADDESAELTRIVALALLADSDLTDTLDAIAERIVETAGQRFGDQVKVSQLPLRRAARAPDGQAPPDPCLNCGMPLGGQYCGNCGQRARSRLISIWELTQEAFGDLFELDSRLWRTLIPLFARPGSLTRDYLQGRRARFMPPFRTYLVLSIFFFLIAFFDPREELGILFEPAPPDTSDTAGDAGSRDAIRDEVLNELVAEGILPAEDLSLPPPGPGTTDDAPATTSDPVDPFTVRIGEDEDGGDTDCDDIEIGDMPDWMSARLTPERVQVVCERVTADDGSAFFSKLLDNVPVGLFILLPLMALVLKMLYPLSKRYYVEHLLFVVHFHAFVFLILTLQILFGRTVTVAGLPGNLAEVTTFAVSLYIPVYLYKGMRRVYEQGHALTSLKFIILAMAYFLGLIALLVIAALTAAFSI